MNGYRFRAKGNRHFSDVVDEPDLEGALRDRYIAHRGPYRLEGPGGRGPWRLRRAALDNQCIRLMRARRGTEFTVSTRSGWTLEIKVVAPTLGLRIIELGLTQEGVDYVFGSEDPNDEFDCSGFTRWVVRSITGRDLPHSADAQMGVVPHLPLSAASRGDLIFMRFGRLGPGRADHVGLMFDPDQRLMLDTRSPANPVAVRPIETGNVLTCGRIVP